MANINRDYLITLDVKTGDIESPEIYFYNTDVGTSNIYVQLVLREPTFTATPIENAIDFSVKLNVIKPGEIIKFLNGVLVNEEEAIYEFDLPADFINLDGKYLIEFSVSCLVSDREEKITSDSTVYRVKKSILTDITTNIEDNLKQPVLMNFNEVGELEVTINGITKVFVPKE